MPTPIYHPIRTPADVSHFLDRTNSLHDAYLIGVQYAHNGHSGKNPHYIDPEQSELRLRYLVTSIYDAVVELIFTAPLQWQLRDQGFDITDTAVSFADNSMVIWADDCSTDPKIRESGSYVIAKTMKWRFL